MRKSSSAICLVLFLAGCGNSVEKRAASGGLSGAGAGALIGGPVGAAIGGAAGATGGAITPMGVDAVAKRGLDALTGKKSQSARYNNTRIGSGEETVKHAQTVLQRKNLYDGPIDGHIGPKMRKALTDYQKQKNLTPNGRLNEATLKSLTSEQH